MRSAPTALALAAATLALHRSPPREPDNTYGLPTGAPIRRAMVRWLRKQKRRVLGTIPTIGTELPASFPPLTGDSGPMALAMTPLISAYWDEAGRRTRERVGLDPDEWTVTSPHTRAAIQAQAHAFCQSTNQTTSLQLATALQELKRELIEGVVEHGESIPELTRRVRRVFDQATEGRARRIAATEASRAVHAAQEMSAAESGVVAGFEWLLSDDACPLCQMVAKQARRVRLGQAFAVVGDNPDYSTVRHPPLHPSCCLPETPVIAPLGVAGVKTQYDGPVVRLHLGDGSHVTVTPNHMLLTPEGFALASSLVEGDDLLSCEVGEPVGGRDPDDDRMPTPISQVFQSWTEAVGMPTRRVPVAPEHLHGDGRFGQGDIHVVTPHGFLWRHLNPEAAEPTRQGSLVWPDVHGSPFVGLRDLAANLFALRDATDGGVGPLREAKAILRAQSRHAEGIGPGAVADRHAGFAEATTDDRAGDARRLRDCLLGLSGQVASGEVRIIQVETLHYTGPVYDLQTLTSLYLIGPGVVSSNCQCAMTEVLTPEFGGPESPEWAQTLDQPKPDE